MSSYDYIIIGGGFFGSMIAQSVPGKVCLIEKESELFTKATTNNQARVHNGYHYPRHHLTAWSSYRNFARFVNEFHEAISMHQTFLYPIAKGSKTNAQTFSETYKKIGSPLEIAQPSHKTLFNMALIEEVFIGQEAVFNAHTLRDILLGRLRNIDIRYNTEVTRIEEHLVHTTTDTLKAKKIILCVYANTNTLLKKSNLPELPLRVEHTTMPVIKVPDLFKHLAITIMDGHYFSIYPFPIKDAHTIHHVELTPVTSDYRRFYDDVCRFIPMMSEMKHLEDIVEDKTILVQNEIDDGRPILYRKDYNLHDFDVIVGGKLDNIYDLLDYMKSLESLNITT